MGIVLKEMRGVYRRDGFMAEVKYIRDHYNCPSIILVDSVFGEHWVAKKNVVWNPLPSSSAPDERNKHEE